jgi:hypothetical protein
MEDILTLDGDAIHVPTGPLTDGTKARIERAVGLNIPDGKHLVLLGLLDKDGPRFGAAVKVGEHWKLAADWDTHHSGMVGIVGVF